MGLWASWISEFSKATVHEVSPDPSEDTIVKIFGRTPVTIWTATSCPIQSSLGPCHQIIFFLISFSKAPRLEPFLQLFCEYTSVGTSGDFPIGEHISVTDLFNPSPRPLYLPGPARSYAACVPKNSATFFSTVLPSFGLHYSSAIVVRLCPKTKEMLYFFLIPSLLLPTLDPCAADYPFQ